MDRIQILIETLNYIEEHLSESISTDEISRHLFYSKSTLEKLFRYVNDISIREYIIRRRMSKAAEELIQFPKKSLLEIGIQVGYGSNEAFTRAFLSVWHVTPSTFRKHPVHYELFPKYRIDKELMEEESMSDKKKVDISKLYDCIKERNGCFIILGDIRSLMPINAISMKAGDLAIITAMKRMEDEASDEDVVFRIGGDEFVILTNSSDEAYAKKLCEGILRKNDEPIFWEGKEIPMQLYVKAVRYESQSLRYAEFFTKLQNEMNPAYKQMEISAENS